MPYIFSFVLCALTGLMLMRLHINDNTDTGPLALDEQDALLSRSSVGENV